jgi:hypothetical protein
LGKVCGIEEHLPNLIDAIHHVDSPGITAYLKCNRDRVCRNCQFLLNSTICPCPMDYLAVLLVEAVETVDQRRKEQEECP